MATPYSRRPRAPGIYRAARALRRLGLISFVLIVVFVAVVAYSAVQVVRSTPHIDSSAVTMEPNGTFGITASFTLSNPGLVPIQSFGLQFRILNSSGDAIVASGTDPLTVPAGGSDIVPIALFLPLTAGESSLLVQNQYLHWDVWGNATYGYLFAVSISVDSNRSWGAPFSDLNVSVGPPALMGGTVVAPVTLSFVDQASFADDGQLTFQVVPPSGPPCASGSFALDVASGSPYSSTQDVPFTPGCNPSGGEITAQYIEGGTEIPLPPQRIP